MSLVDAQPEIDYPESDGKPMGETDLHIHWMIRLRDILKHRYHGQQAYVASNLLLYFVEGNPRKFVVPDVFVVKDSDPGFRRTYKVWEEGKAPHVVLEVTSQSSKREDELLKPKTYAAIGVAEYFVYDPTSDYLHPPLQGHRLIDGVYRRITPDAEDRLICEQLGMWLRLQGSDLVLADVQTGQQLLTEAEAEHAAREAEHAAREAAEAEVRRLREELRRRK